MTPEDVLRVARFYLQEDNRTTAELVPETAAGGGTEARAATGPVGG